MPPVGTSIARLDQVDVCSPNNQLEIDRVGSAVYLFYTLMSVKLE